MAQSILIVEDEQAMREALVTVMQSGGYVTSTAKDGEEGLKKALAENPNLIILDILMPKMNGVEMMKRLRVDTWGSKVPIIMLTNAEVDRSILNEIMANHPAYCLMKSTHTLKEVLEKVDELFNDVQPRDGT